MTKNRLFWWLIVCTTLFAVALSHHVGFLLPIYMNDATAITFLISVIFILSTISIGYKSFSKRLCSYKIEWFTSDACMTLGMLGTIIGFMIMLFGTFTNITITDTESIKIILNAMSSGLYTALSTTLVGLVSSLILKTQLILFDNEE